MWLWPVSFLFSFQGHSKPSPPPQGPSSTPLPLADMPPLFFFSKEIKVTKHNVLQLPIFLQASLPALPLEKRTGPSLILNCHERPKGSSRPCWLALLGIWHCWPLPSSLKPLLSQLWRQHFPLVLFWPVRLCGHLFPDPPSQGDSGFVEFIQFWGPL